MPRTDWKFILQIVLFFVPVGYVMIVDHVRTGDNVIAINEHATAIAEVRRGATEELKGYQAIILQVNARLDAMDKKIDDGFRESNRRMDAIVDGRRR